MRGLSVVFLTVFSLIAALPAFAQTPVPEVQAVPEPAYPDSARIDLCRKKGDPPLEPSETEAPPMRVDGSVTRPEIIYQSAPSYSAAGAEGTVILEATIDEHGCVRQPKVLRSVGKKVDAAALKAIRKWVFRPATVNGQPVRVYYVLTISFGH